MTTYLPSEEPIMGDGKNIQVGLKSTEIQPTSNSRGAILVLEN